MSPALREQLIKTADEREALLAVAAAARPVRTLIEEALAEGLLDGFRLTAKSNLKRLNEALAALDRLNP